jgi:hypothetical protein
LANIANEAHQPHETGSASSPHQRRLFGSQRFDGDTYVYHAATRLDAVLLLSSRRLAKLDVVNPGIVSD